MIRLRPERTERAHGARGDRGRAGRDPRTARLRRRLETRLPRADLARARRDARGRSDRGGRALQAAGDPVHAAAPRGDVRAADARAAPAAGGRGRARRQPATPRCTRRPSSPRATCGCPSRSPPRRPRSARVLYASLSSPPAATPTQGRTTSRCSRSRASTATSAATCPRSTGTSPASSTAGSPRRNGPSSRSTPRSASSRRYERTTEPYLHPGKAARTAEGWLGELHPALLDGDWGAFELDLDALAEAAPQVVAFEEVSPYPEVRQDLAFVVDDEVPASDDRSPRSARRPATCCATSRSSTSTANPETIGEGKRSLAFRLAFGSPEGTLTDEDVAPRARVDRRRAGDALRRRPARLGGIGESQAEPPAHAARPLSGVLSRANITAIHAPCVLVSERPSHADDERPSANPS